MKRIFFYKINFTFKTSKKIKYMQMLHVHSPQPLFRPRSYKRRMTDFRLFHQLFYIFIFITDIVVLPEEDLANVDPL